MTTDTRTAFQRALDHAADNGIEIPPEIKQRAETAYNEGIAEERRRIDAANARKTRFQRSVDSFIERYPALQDGVVKLGNWTMAVIKLFAVNGLISVIMFAALIAETSRVVVGLTAIEASPFLAVLISIVAVASVFFLSFARYYIEREANHVEEVKYKWSLRLFAQNWRYRLGLGGEKWKEIKTTPAQSIIAAQRLITFAVIITALYGSMAHTIARHEGTWMQALVSIVRDSTLQEFSGWVIGLLITFAIALIATTSSQFVASRAKLLEDSTFATGESRIDLIGAERAGHVVTTYYEQAKDAQRRAKRRAMPVQYPYTVQSVQPQAAVQNAMNTQPVQSTAQPLALKTSEHAIAINRTDIAQELHTAQPVQSVQSLYTAQDAAQVQSVQYGTLAERINAYIAAHPEAVNMSAGELMSALNAAGISVQSRSTVNNVLRNHRQ